MFGFDLILDPKGTFHEQSLPIVPVEPEMEHKPCQFGTGGLSVETNQK